MFINKSIAAFNNIAFNSATIDGMKEIHPTTARLYAACEALRRIVGQSAVARLLAESPQTVKNWETRGVSEGGALKAQKVVECNAIWLLEGMGQMTFGASLLPSVVSRSKHGVAEEAAGAWTPPDWPLDRITPHQWWHELKPRHRRKAQDLVFTYLEDHLHSTQKTAHR